MMKYKFHIIFLSAVIVGTAVIYLVSAGYYPVALVGSRIITAKTFVKDYGMADMYYRNVLKAEMNSQQNKDSSSTVPDLTPVQIQQAVLSMLIENTLVENGARREAGSSFDSIIDKKVNEAIAEPGIEKAIQTIYGVGLDDFKKEILAPQAERDILAGNLFLKGEKIEDWLAEKKRTSRVIIFSGKFYWDGEKVVSK